MRDETEVQIVAFDLAGAEKGYPADDFEQAFMYAQRKFLNKTVHAGEAYGPESIFSAITKLHADRIGHGLHLFDKKLIFNKENIVYADCYVEKLSKHIADRRIPLEVCVTSNMQTTPELTSVIEHPLREMLERKIAVTLCTDNRLVSHTTISAEYSKAVNHLDITPKMLKDIAVGGFKRSFFYRSYLDKRIYVRQISDYYDQIAREFNVQG